MISGRDSVFKDPHASDRRWYASSPHLAENQAKCEETVRTCLVRAGLTNVMTDSLRSPAPVSDDARVSQIFLPKIPAKYHHWQVMSDGSCQCEDWISNDDVLGRYTWSSVEIASSVFRSSARPDNWIKVTAAQELQIAQVCHSLTSNLRIRLSQSCGLHCHLGLGGDAIPPDTVRRFVTTMWLLEDAVLMLCAPWRSHSSFALPITKFSELAREEEVWKLAPRDSHNPSKVRMFIGDGLWKRLPLLQKQRLALIWTLPLKDLKEAVSTRDGTSRGTVSVRGCCGPQDCGEDLDDDLVEDPFGNFVQNTIEIRYASSTLIPRELTSWTNLFLRLFQLCNFYDDTNAIRLATVLHHVAEALDPRRTIHAGHELLRQIDLGDDVPVWTAAQHRWVLENDRDHVRRSPFVEPQ